MNYFTQEVEQTRELFDLEKILLFQAQHDIQIIRGDDFQYVCYIDKIGFAACLTPLYALCIAIKQYKYLTL